MKYEDIKQYENKYGLLEWGPSKERKSFHGTIKIVDKESDIVFFKVKGMATQKIAIETLVGFTEKEMLSEVTEHAKKEVFWDGGILIYKDQLKFPLKDGYLEGTLRRTEIPLKR